MFIKKSIAHFEKEKRDEVKEKLKKISKKKIKKTYNYNYLKQPY